MDSKALAAWLDDPFWLSGEFPAKQKDMRHEAARILRDVVPRERWYCENCGCDHCLRAEQAALDALETE